MQTYLSLSRISYYFKDTNKEFKALFGILYLTNDINSSQQFYASHFLSKALGIDKIPKFQDLLIMLHKIGSHSLKINSDSNGKIFLENTNQELIQPVFDNKYQFNIDINKYPNIAAGLELISHIINKTNRHFSKSQNKSDMFNLVNVDEKIFNDIEFNGYSVIENFFKESTLKELHKITSNIAKNELDTNNAYLYGENGKNQRVYNLISKHKIFRDILDSIWLEKFLNVVFDRNTFHEKYGLSSLAAHIVPPGGEAQLLHLDNAVPEPIPKWVMRFIIVIPLVDFTKENGPTAVVPKSHKLYRKPTPEDEASSKVTLLTAKAGSLILWDGNLWHKSTQNNSNKKRSALIISYGASFFKEICGEEEYLVVVPDKIKKTLSPRLQSLIGMNRGIKEGSSYLPD